MKLLIADDEMIIRQGLINLNWKDIGIKEVMVADNGLKVLTIISSFQPDIILTDIRMPGIDGLQIAKEINRNKLACKIIILSGFGTFDYAKQALQNRVFEYLLKPSNPEEIINTVRRAKNELEKESLREQKEHLNRTQDEIFSVGEISNSKMILDYIENNYMNDISLTTLAEYTHFSPSYLSKLIKKETSYNFMKILGIKRMLKATELLTTTNLKIYTICEKIGINDQRYFSQQFRKTFSKTPAEYRKENTNKPVVNLLDFISQVEDSHEN